jgi:hypothetical protein
MVGVMFIGCAVETLRDEVLLDAASTPPVKDSDCSDGLW